MPLLIRCLVLLSAVALASCATGHSGRPGAADATQREVAQPPAAALGGATTESTVTLSAKVVRVNAAKRLLTLEAPDGRRVTARVHARVTDLDRLQPGDVVRATYYESVAYDVRAPGAAAPGAPPPPLPGAIDSRSVTITSRITAVNESAGTLTLQAPDADPITVRVKHPEALRKVKAGDLADITLTEAVAVAIEKTP